MGIVIVDNHPLMRKGLASIFQMDGRYEVVGEVDDAKDVLNLFESVVPSLIIMDLQLGQDSGLNLIAEVRARGYDGKILIFTTSISKQDFTQVHEFGVDGVVLKDALPEEILQAVHIIHKGRRYYDSNIINLKMNSNLHTESSRSLDEITPKEMEVLLELGKGRSNKEISQNLFITEYTVKKHVSQILSKLDLADRTHAALFANAVGLVSYTAN